ncbi:MAG: hypothetical protein IPO81_09585 [Kouleothrix sp.]|nr:hypothetical protein [Kouleothrix sp.]
MAKTPRAPDDAGAQPTESLIGRCVHVYEYDRVMLGRIVAVNEDSTVAIAVDEVIATRTLHGVHQRNGNSNGWELI